MFSRHFFRLAARSAVPSGRRLMSVKARTAKKAEASSLVLMGGILGGVAIYQVTFSATTDIAAVKKDIAAAIDAEFEKRGDGTSMAPTLVRLAWHASGTYSAADGTGGSNGAHMRFAPESEWGANAGLQSARDFLEPIKKKHPEMSYADLWTLAGATAIEEMGGPQIPWRPGRTDSPQPTLVPDGRLPAADSGCTAADTAHLRDIFGRMGFNDKEIVCLAGAHAVGRCHTEASGYWGPWTNAETTFSTEYFRLLLEEKWTLKKKHEGKKWTGPRQYENPDGTLMMLPADMTLVQEPAFRQHVEFYAKNEDAFNKDFATTFGKLLELGVPFPAVQKKNFIDETLSGVLSKVKGILGI